MGQISFYLKKAEVTTKKSLIILQWKYNGRKLVFSTKQTIDKKQWNPDRQRVKNSKQTTRDGKHLINDLLDNLEEVCQKAYNTEIKNGIPSPDMLRRYLTNFINQNDKGPDTPTLFKLIDRFINNEIQYRGKKKANNTLNKYKTAKGHLKEFESKKKYPIDFNTVTLDFFYKFVAFLREKGLAQNTIAKDIQVIKTFMNEAVDLRYTTNIEHKNRKFSASWQEVDSVYLTEKEIIDLFNYDLSHNKKLEQVRDLFVFGCCIGLRFTDYSTVKPENIILIDGQRFIKMYTQKTGEQVIIPCNPIVLQIFEKYADRPNNLPRSLSNQKFNKYIKEACKVAGMNEKGRLIKEPDKELWECISSHTCRRSFSANLYLESYPVIEIMKITGHRSEKNFLKYIKVSKLDAAKRLSKHIHMKWSEKLLKVAG